MLSTNFQFHLAVALDGAGWHPAAWREPRACPGELFTARHWLDQVRRAQDGLLDFVTIEDSHRLQSTRGGAPDGRTDQVRGRLDATLIAAWVAPRTRHVGIVPAAATALTEPFLLSTQIATLDFISLGRAGWQAQIFAAPGDGAGAYVGPRRVAEGDAGWAEAAEHIDVVRRLWDSWEDGAEIRDAAANRFFDRRRVHHIDFAGEHFRVKGPSITPRPPQGQPIVAMPAATGPATEIAVRHADLVFATPRDEDGLAAERRRIDDRATAAGRDPSSLRALADIVVFLDPDPSAARERRDRLDRSDGACHHFDTIVFAGTPAQLADRLIAWHELGNHGFRLRPGTVPHDLDVITRALVEELQVRGAFRRRYEAGSLRELLGFSRPDSRYGPRPTDPVAVA
jgi:alkanesulfonate monooxygenase SsuD/methylene tetrahydromethanopterin reductase-like flavin-dependent oxidoreductase (luciferase family)